VVDLTSRAAHEQELFSFEDWQFIQWLAETHADPEGFVGIAGSERSWNCCNGWCDGATRAGCAGREPTTRLSFDGQLANWKPHLETSTANCFSRIN
jgi:hypothetical protein